MTQVEKEEDVSVKYNESKKHYDWSDNTPCVYTDKENIEDKKIIMSMFENE